MASFYLIEDIRENAVEACKSLKNQGYAIAILSGDTKERVKAMADQLGVTAYNGRCSPQDKANWIENAASNCALMIGDGANDSLAFEAAVCRGAPVVDRSILEESSDFFFFGRDLHPITQLIEIANRRRCVLKTVFGMALIYNFFAAIVCLMGWMHPLLAAVLMPLISIATVTVTFIRLK